MTKYSCLIDNRSGGVFAVPFTVAKWTTKHNGEAGKLEFSYLRACGFDVEPGAVVRFDVDGRSIFYGYVFNVNKTQKEDAQCVAYDQMFYLNYKDTYVIKQKPASEILQMVCKDMGLSVGAVESTGYNMDLLCEDKKLMEIIQDALDRTVANTHKWYMVYDNAGEICLASLDALKTDLVIGDKSLATGYDYKQNISDDTYNQIKLVRKDKDKGTREVFIIKNAGTIAKWGTLQYYATVDEGLTDGQVKEKGEMLLRSKNRVLRSLSLDGLGDSAARGGAAVFVTLPDINISTWFVISEASHTFEHELHTMKLSMYVPNIQEG